MARGCTHDPLGPGDRSSEIPMDDWNKGILSAVVHRLIC